MVKSFCKDCPDRHTICHDTCPQYQKYKLELKAENAYTPKKLIQCSPLPHQIQFSTR